MDRINLVNRKIRVIVFKNIENKQAELQKKSQLINLCTIDSRRFTMPTISMFYGILVTLFFEDNDRHHLPHFHVRYQGEKAAIAIEDGRVLAGSLPTGNLP